MPYPVIKQINNLPSYNVGNMIHKLLYKVEADIRKLSTSFFSVLYN